LLHYQLGSPVRPLGGGLPGRRSRWQDRESARV